MTMKPDGESPSTSSLFLPRRRGSLSSLSTASQIDKDILAQALDQIHSNASQTETLTTFNEFTSPPSSSSGTDGKGIASELQGGLSGLYSRIRASVGNVRDIVTPAAEDGVDEQSLRSSQHGTLGATSSTKQLDAVKLSGPPAPTLHPRKSLGVKQQAASEKLVPDGEMKVIDPYTKPSKLSLGNLGGSSQPISSTSSALHSPLPPLTQGALGTAVRPAVAEINVSATKERDPSGNVPSNGAAMNPAISQMPGLGSRIETQLSDGHKLQVPRTTLESAMIAASRSSRTTDDYFMHSGFDGIDDLVHPPKKLQSNLTKNINDGPRNITEPATARDDLLETSTGVKKDDAKFEPSKDRLYQCLDISKQKSSAPPQAGQSGPHDRRSSQKSSAEIAAKAPHAAPRQSSVSGDQLGEFDVRQIVSGLHSRVSGAPPQDDDPRTMNVFSQIKSKLLNKEYWMRDENARDCFYCGDPFSTFRRKHHCRTCGQIFDAKCTSLLSGAQFGQSGSLRVCKPCEGIINGYDDSSDFSDDSYQPVQGLRPRHGSAGASDALASPASRSSTPVLEDFRQSPKHPDLTVPTMAIPATRRAAGESNRKAVLEIDAERTLLRPSSSRSLKSSFTNRPYSSGHRRHNSRHQNLRAFKAVGEESAPFHRNLADERVKQGRLPAFHDDNIIDPDLAPYLSDEGSSGDEQVSIMSAMNGDGSRSYDSERHGFTGLLSSKKGRSRIGEKSVSGVTFASRDPENSSVSNMRSMNLPRSAKRRNLSIASSLHLRPSPRNHRASAILPAVGFNLHESNSSSGLSQMLSSNASIVGSRMIRSSSMRGAAAPAVELNNASLQHVRKLLRQLLQDSNIPSIASWERALVPILLQSTDDVNPDVLNGDDIDIRHYVKLKKISGGRPGDTSYVSGLVFTKNLALKSMPRSISHPNILILTFALEYARHHQHFMSLEPVIRQEREFLQNLVSRIVALRPQLLLVQRNVSGLALEFLEQAKIATAYNVKASVLEAVSRCTQTRIISSIDKLAIKPVYTGKCEDFYLKTYVHGNNKKTYMFLSGCAKELGCTIVLRGAKAEILAKIKRITEFMVYVVYNLKLETCLMRDEFALIPSSNDTSPLLPGPEHNRQTSQDVQYTSITPTIAISESTSPVQASAVPTPAKGAKARVSEVVKQQSAESVRTEASVPDDVPMPTFYGDMVEQHKTKILSASPFVKFAQPYLLMRAREQERRLVYLKRLRDQGVLDELNDDDRLEPQKFDLIKPEMIHETIRGASKKVREVIHAVHDAEYDKALHNYKTHTKQWEAYIAGNINMFDPYEHQNIAVLYSVVCTITTVPCSGPDLLALSFYNEHETDEEFEADCTLGQYVEDLCLGANTVCTANGCERKMFDHHRQYVHGEAQVSVFVERYPSKLRGLQNTILMWSCCRICGEETQVVPMSENTWRYSFGKYLELSFWSSKLRARAVTCPHDLHRDHLRYFGFHDIALRLHYDPIKLLEIIVPRARVTWKVDNDLRFKNELFTKTEERLNKYMTSVKARIRSIRVDSVVPEKTGSCKQEVESLLKRAGDEHHALVQTLQDSYMNSKHYEIIPLNQALRATQLKVAEWDNTFAEFDRNFFPSEKDIRRLATLQLKKIFLDRDDSTTSVNSTDESSTSSIPEDTVAEKSNADETPALIPHPQSISSEKEEGLLGIVEKHALQTESSDAGQFDYHKVAPATALPIVNSNGPQVDQKVAGLNEIQHLDLAVTPSLPDKMRDDEISTPPGDPRDDISRKVITEQDTFMPDEGQRSSPSSNPSPDESTAADEILSASDSTPKNPTLSDLAQVSGIPRRVGPSTSPILCRAQSHPTHFQGDRVGFNPSFLTLQQGPVSTIQARRLGESAHLASTVSTAKPAEKKLSERLGLGVLKQNANSAHSMIPRSIVNRRKESNVSTLAKHFEQLSREFEKERIRERRQRAAKTRQARAHPMAVSKPIVEIYRDVHEAVEERDPSDEDLLSPVPHQDEHEESVNTVRHMADTTDSQTPGDGFHVEDTTAETTETEENNHLDSRIASDAEGEGGRSEEEHSLLDDIDMPGSTDEPHPLSPSEGQLDLKLDLPKHEKSSLMKMLTNFWAERSASGWQPLDYPLHASDHIFADSDIIVREDEPSSLIAFALGSEDYQAKLRSISENFGGIHREREKSFHQDSMLDTDEQLEVERSLLRSTGTHLKYQFQEGSAKMLCKIFFAEQFDAVRRKCGVDERIVESLSRCLKWDSKGGKTKSVFLKTLDDRLVLKSLSPIETQAFLRFAPAYFRIMSEALFHELPSVIAKMLGFYQIIIKNPVTGIEFNWFLLLMENLFYDRSPNRIFDLKGSMRNRRIQSTGEQNEVLLDENMVEFIYESPLFAREHSKRILRASVWNDTLFLSRQNVMDYSLMIAIDENRKELVIGIIDCIRTYTWDKKLETWIKDRGKNRPTVTSPREYKNRFREAMGRYVLQAPNCWHQFKAQQVETRPLRLDDRDDMKDGDGDGELLRLP
ncbi:1-phosphatidylinositol-3-phosphate 5-kinase [Pseudocyphellaria aurata]|nr:1-phosphatidylinositol-3-phosphate 5-kinase [Pseudocyphellaria aurata]